MLAYINKKLHYVNKSKLPVIIIYGSSDERMQEISGKISDKQYCVIPVKMDDDFVAIIIGLNPAMVIIGGRCHPDDRLRIRAIAAKSNYDVLLSEPGVAYMNTVGDIARDVISQFNVAKETYAVVC